MEDIYSQEPKFCRCTQSSVAHVRGCYEGWGSSPEKSQKDTPPMITPEKELCENCRHEKEWHNSGLRCYMDTSRGCDCLYFLPAKETI